MHQFIRIQYYNNILLKLIFILCISFNFVFKSNCLSLNNNTIIINNNETNLTLYHHNNFYPTLNNNSNFQLKNFVPIFLSGTTDNNFNINKNNNNDDNDGKILSSSPITTQVTPILKLKHNLTIFDSFYIKQIPIDNKNQVPLKTINIHSSSLSSSLTSSSLPLAASSIINLDNNNSIKNTIIESSFRNPITNWKDDKNSILNNNSNGNNNSTNNNINNQQQQKIYEFIKKFDLRLKNTRNMELCVTYIQQIFDTMDFKLINKNDSEIIQKISKRITNKLQKALNTINYLHNEILYNITNITKDQHNHDTENNNLTMKMNKINDIYYNYNKDIYLNTIIQPCPFEDFTLEQNYNKKQIEIINYLKYEKNTQNNYENTINYKINMNIMNELNKLQMNNSNQYKNIYFLSRYDHASDHYCQYYYNDQNFRYLYVSAIKNKHIFLLIENGNAFSEEQFELTRTFVINIIQLLSDDDYLTIITVSDKIIPIRLKDDHSKNSLYMYRCTLDNRKEFIDQIEKLYHIRNSTTNHVIGFEYMFELLLKHNFTTNKQIEFLYITRGLLTDLIDPRNVLLAIANGQKKLNFPIKINTCAVIIDEKRIMYERQFLRDIAKQNFSKYNISVNDWYNENTIKFHNITGQMFVITKRHPERLIKTSCAIFESLFIEKFLDKQIKFHYPVLDYNTRDFIISITQPIRNYGIIGINMYLNDLAEDIINFKKFDDSYAYITDINGIVIYHPAFSRPIATQNNIFPIDIGYLESSTKDFYKVRKIILNEIKGSIKSTYNNDDKIISYSWERILNAYIVCIVTIGNKRPEIKLSWPTKDVYYQHQRNLLDLLYHRIDLIPPKSTSLCRHFRQIATLDSETVFLSASSFQSPFAYLKNNKECNDEICIHNSKSIMAYIKDATNLLANPGLLPSIRNDVTALYSAMSYLKNRHQESIKNIEIKESRKYIIRRYIATMNGVILLYPGSVLGIDLEPSRRPWFRKAMKFPGKIVLTEPYLDAGGAGYIVTITHTIFEGRTNALHNAERDRPVAIVAIDVPYSYFYKLVLDSSTFCSERNIKCIIIEDEGYIIAHPSILEPVTNEKNKRRPLEHIIHKEPFVANDMLNHKQLVTKKLCANYQNRKIQRYYTFNTSLIETLTNFVYGERTRYQIRAIHGTNLFAIILNTTCIGEAFCPCNTVDRICLNCNRMDQTDCECPCECPLKIPMNAFDNVENYNASNFTNKIISYCEPPSENFEAVNSLSYDWNMILKSCSNINCDLYATQLDCLGVMGCEWCQLDIDGNPFSTPFCTTQNSCFNGVLGSITPYGEGELGSVVAESTIPSAYSAIGPVGGAIIALCLVVGFAMYCYRQNLDSVSDQFYADSMQEENFGLQLSRFNYDDVLPHEDSDLSGGISGNNGMRNMHKDLTHPISITNISPYHMSSGGYKRPNGESDHGYSTMTPHEDSENMCFTLVEPLINNKKRNSFSGDSISIHTSSASSTLNPHDHNMSITSSLKNNTALVDKHMMTNLKSINNTVLPLNKKKLYDDNKATKNITEHQLTSPHHILAPVTVHRHMEAS